MKTFLRYWLPAILYCLLIFFSSSRSNVQVSHDKIIHTCAYIVMAFLFARAFGAHASTAWKIWFFAFTMTVLFGASDEFHQRFVPGRNASLDDLAADTLGAIIGASLYVSLIRLPKYFAAHR